MNAARESGVEVKILRWQRFRTLIGRCALVGVVGFELIVSVFWQWKLEVYLIALALLSPLVVGFVLAVFLAPGEERDSGTPAGQRIPPRSQEQNVVPDGLGQWEVGRLVSIRDSTERRVLGYAAGALAGMVPLLDFAFQAHASGGLPLPQGLALLVVIGSAGVAGLFSGAALSRLYVLSVLDRDPRLIFHGWPGREQIRRGPAVTRFETMSWKRATPEWGIKFAIDLATLATAGAILRIAFFCITLR